MKTFRSFSEATSRTNNIDKIRARDKAQNVYAAKRFTKRKGHEADRENNTNEAKSTKASFDLDALDVVDYKPGEDDITKRKIHKRRRQDESVVEDITKMSSSKLKFHRKVPHGSYTRKEIDTEHKRRSKVEPNYHTVKASLNDDVNYETAPESTEELDEVLNVAQRRKRSIIARRNKSKMKRGRAKQSRRIADKGRINQRARRQAKAELVKKLTKGVAKADLSPQRKAEIERRLQKMGNRVDRNQRKLIPSVRKRDRGM